MRILVVSDIHANWPALAAIDQPFDVCLCLGDLVDYGPDPAPCVRWAMSHATYAIRGNHDHGVAQGIPVVGDTGFRYLTRASRPSMWDALGHEERRYLLQLPVTQRFTLGGKRFLLVHATPRDPLDEYLLKDPQTWAKRLHNVEADVVRVGHTHVQFNIQINGVIVLNPGSVGLPRDGDPRRASRSSRTTRSSFGAWPIPSRKLFLESRPCLGPVVPRRSCSTVLRLGRLPLEINSEMDTAAPDEPDPDDELESESPVEQRPD